MVPATINEIQNMAKRWHLYKEFYQMLMLIRFLLQEGQEIEVLCHLQGGHHLWKSDTKVASKYEGPKKFGVPEKKAVLL